MINQWIEDLEWLDRAAVVVCGGGPAGVAAALSAARNGAEVLLLEQCGALGGMASLGLVPMLGRTTDGVHQVAAGICMEIAEEVVRRMGMTSFNGCWQPIRAELVKQVCDEKIIQAGVKLYFGQKLAAAACRNGRIVHLAFAGPQGLKKVSGAVFIDATGDGALSAFAGADFQLGDADGVTMSPTLCVQYANVDWEKCQAAARQGRDDRRIWLDLCNAGTAPLPEYHFVGAFQTGPTTATGNLGHIYGINGCGDADLTKGYLEGRKIATIIHRFYVEHVPGFEHSELVNTAGLLGVRETRRIVGDYQLDFDDYQRKASFPDEIARYYYPVDIHASSTDPNDQKRVEQEMARTTYQRGESYGIPYRSLLPVGLENLLTAGRCISCDRPVQSSLRVMPSCFLTGQAAGAAAFLSLSANGSVRTVDPVALRDVLRNKVGAYLP